MPTKIRPPSSGGNGNKLNTAKHHVKNDRVSQVIRQPLSAGAWKIVDNMKCQSCDNRERNVHGRSGGSNQHHVASRPLQRPKIDRHGLGIAKKKWRVEQQQHAGQ